MTDANAKALKDVSDWLESYTDDPGQILEDHGVTIRDALSALIDSQRWQPIETAPKDGSYVLLAWDGQCIMSHWLDNSNTTAPWKGFTVMGLRPWPKGKPTHWQPLPAPPALPAHGGAEGKE